VEERRSGGRKVLVWGGRGEGKGAFMLDAKRQSWRRRWVAHVQWRLKNFPNYFHGEDQMSHKRPPDRQRRARREIATIEEACKNIVPHEKN